MAADGDDEGKAEEVKREGSKAEGEQEDVAALPELKPVVTRGKHDAPRAEPPEADDFGLPVKPPRRRNYSLDELESPEAVKVPELPTLDGKDVDPWPTGGNAAASMPDKPREPDCQTAETNDVDGAAESTVEKDATAVEASKSGGKGHRRTSSLEPQKPTVGATSEWSHQQLAPHVDAPVEDEEEEQWQAMPALAEHRIYDDWGKVIAKSYDEVDDIAVAYGNLGGAGKGYTREAG